MTITEILMILFVYSSLLLYFLVPFGKSVGRREAVSFQSSYKNNLVRLIFHKKAIFALLLFIMTLLIIQARFSGAESHYNEHSGLPAISNQYLTIYMMGIFVIYTIGLMFAIGYVRTLKEMKHAKKM